MRRFGRRASVSGAGGPLTVTFLTDYGPGSEHVGALHLMVAAGAPTARLVDLVHDVPAQDVRQGAVLLARLAPLAPAAIHVAVVDPGVGGPRRAVALATGAGGVLIGPDNGLLMLAADALGVRGARLLPAPGAGAPATFHGRDVFAPAAARLAAGAPFSALGEPIDPRSLVALLLPEPRVEEGLLVGEVAGRDAFGNLQLFASGARLRQAGFVPGARIGVECCGAVHAATVARTFADVSPGALLVYPDAHDRVAIAVNGGDAAARLAVEPGEEITLRR